MSDIPGDFRGLNELVRSTISASMAVRYDQYTGAPVIEARKQLVNKEEFMEKHGPANGQKQFGRPADTRVARMSWITVAILRSIFEFATGVPGGPC